MLEPNLYRVRVNGCPGWAEHRVCTLGISVGQPYHEGEKFAATVEWAARHFERIRVDVSDTLQRHRLIGEGVPAAQAAVLSRRKGDEWIMRALPVLSACGRPYTVIRWDGWLRHQDYAGVYGAYSRLAESDPALRAAVKADVEGFLARQARRGGRPVQDENEARAASRAYLLEELSAITLQGRDERSARIYPGPELASFKAVRAGEVKGAPPGLDRDYYVHVNLERRGMLAPESAPKAAALG
jgi:tRNA-dependent cyclodipeptide synthase